jgi:hypothetical protein
MGTRARTALRVAVGAIIGATLGLAVVLIAADMVSTADGTSVAWAKGLVVMYLAAPVSMGIGAIAGGILRARPPKASKAPAWTTPPSGTWWGHYPVSWIAGWLVSFVVALFVVLPMASLVLSLFLAFIGMLFPLLNKLTWLLVMATVIYSMVSVGRSVMRLVDRSIYRRRSRAEPPVLGVAESA